MFVLIIRLELIFLGTTKFGGQKFRGTAP